MPKYAKVSKGLTNDNFTQIRSLSDNNKIDQETAESFPCEDCGSDCRYEGWTKAHSYVALSICMTCGNTVSF